MKMLLQAMLWGLLVGEGALCGMNLNFINEDFEMDKIPSDIAIAKNIDPLSSKTTATFLGAYSWKKRFEYTIESLRTFWQPLQEKHSPEALTNILRLICQEDGDGHYTLCRR